MDKEAPGHGAKVDQFQRKTLYRALVPVLVIVIAVRAFHLWCEYENVLSAEQGRSQSLAHVLAEHLDRTLVPIKSALDQLAVHSERIGGPKAPAEAWQPVLAATLSGLSGIGSLNVIDEEGVITSSTNPAVTGTSRRNYFL